MFCEFKDMFGKPNEGSHKYRIPCLDIAAVDVIATFIVGLLIYIIIGGSYKNIIIILFLSSILLHRLFCVRTKVDKFLFD